MAVLRNQPGISDAMVFTVDNNRTLYMKGIDAVTTMRVMPCTVPLNCVTTDGLICDCRIDEQRTGGE